MCGREREVDAAVTILLYRVTPSATCEWRGRPFFKAELEESRSVVEPVPRKGFAVNRSDAWRPRESDRPPSGLGGLAMLLAGGVVRGSV